MSIKIKCKCGSEIQTNNHSSTQGILLEWIAFHEGCYCRLPTKPSVKEKPTITKINIENEVGKEICYNPNKIYVCKDSQGALRILHKNKYREYLWENALYPNLDIAIYYSAQKAFKSLKRWNKLKIEITELSSPLELLRWVTENRNSDAAADYGYHVTGPDEIFGPYTEKRAFYEANEINKPYVEDLIKNGKEAFNCVAIVKTWKELQHLNKSTEEAPIRFKTKRKKYKQDYSFNKIKDFKILSPKEPTTNILHRKIDKLIDVVDYILNKGFTSSGEDFYLAMHSILGDKPSNEYEEITIDEQEI